MSAIRRSVTAALEIKDFSEGKSIDDKYKDLIKWKRL